MSPTCSASIPSWRSWTISWATATASTVSSPRPKLESSQTSPELRDTKTPFFAELEQELSAIDTALEEQEREEAIRVRRAGVAR